MDVRLDAGTAVRRLHGRRPNDRCAHAGQSSSLCPPVEGGWFVGRGRASADQRLVGPLGARARPRPTNHPPSTGGQSEPDCPACAHRSFGRRPRSLLTAGASVQPHIHPLGGTTMLDQELLELGLKFHGHKCPAMPMGLRTGLAAMNALGVEHAADGQLVALVEIDEDHCATCFADGVQVATGCTFGKGNIRRLGYGKFGLTLVDKRTQRAVRVVPKGSVMMKNRESEFMKLRSSGTPASQIPAEIADPLVAMVSAAPDEALLDIGEVTAHEWHDAPHTFEAFLCPECGEMVVERNARVKGGVAICQPCAEILSLIHISEPTRR